MSHMRKLLLESLIHKAAQARVQPFPQLSVVSLTPQLSVINCQSDTQVHVTLTSMPSPLSFRNKHSGTYTQTQDTHTRLGGEVSTYTYQLDRYLPHLCHLKRPACQKRQRLVYSHFLPARPFFSLFCNTPQVLSLPAKSFQLYIFLTTWQKASCSILCECIYVCVFDTRPRNDFTPLNLCYSFFPSVSQQHGTILSLCKIIYEYVNENMLIDQSCSLMSRGISQVAIARWDFGI